MKVSPLKNTIIGCWVATLALVFATLFGVTTGILSTTMLVASSILICLLIGTVIYLTFLFLSGKLNPDSSAGEEAWHAFRQGQAKAKINTFLFLGILILIGTVSTLVSLVQTIFIAIGIFLLAVPLFILINKTYPI